MESGIKKRETEKIPKEKGQIAEVTLCAAYAFLRGRKYVTDVRNVYERKYKISKVTPINFLSLNYRKNYALY